MSNLENTKIKRKIPTHDIRAVEKEGYLRTDHLPGVSRT
jgi:hypothetical protein